MSCITNERVDLLIYIYDHIQDENVIFAKAWD
jgi:hypothetical protein